MGRDLEANLPELDGLYMGPEEYERLLEVLPLTPVGSVGGIPVLTSPAAPEGKALHFADGELVGVYRL